MKRNRRRNAITIVVLIIFILLWISTGDFIAALLSFTMLALFIVLVAAVVGYLIANSPAWFRRIRGISREDYLRQLEQNAQAIRENYQVHGVLTFEDHTTGCLVHLIDVGGDRLLCLHGQQYYDFEPIVDDPELNQPRQFPTKTFSLLRHKKRNEVLELYPGPDVFEPRLCDPQTNLRPIRELGIGLKDGEVVSGITLSAIVSLFKAKASD